MRYKSTRRLASGTSILALAAMATAFGGKARATCEPVGGADFVCDDANIDGQVIESEGDANVTTEPGFSVNVITGEGSDYYYYTALEITATGDVDYDDDNASPLTAAYEGYGLSIDAGGSVTVDTAGAITADDSTAVTLEGQAITLTTGAGAITGGDGGVEALAGAGDVNVTIGAGGVTSGGYGAVEAESDGGNVSVTTTAGDIVAEGGGEGGGSVAIEATTGGAGTVTVVTGTGDVTGSNTGILAQAATGAISVTTGTGSIIATNGPTDVDGGYYGSDVGGGIAIDARSQGGIGPITVVAGDGEADGGAYGIVAGFVAGGTSDDGGDGPAITGADGVGQQIDITVTGDVTGGTTGILLSGEALDYSFDYIPGPGPVPLNAAQVTAQNADAPRTVTIEVGASVTGGIGIEDRDVRGIFSEIVVAGKGGGTQVTETTTYYAAESSITVAGTLTGGSQQNAGDDHFTLVAGGTVTGNVDGGGELPDPVTVTEEGVGIGIGLAGPVRAPAVDTFTDTFILDGAGAGGIDATLDVTGFDFDDNGIFGEAALTVTEFEEFQKTGTSTFGLTGTNAEVGTLDMQAGGISVLGNLSGLTLLGQAGTTISGIGTIGGIDTTGLVSPGALGAGGGSAIGTLSVAGDVSLGAGSELAVQLADNGGSDLLAASGSATLSQGSTLSATLAGGSGALPDQTLFTVLTAEAGIDGTFGAIEEDIPDIDLDPIYNENSIQIRAVADVEIEEREDLSPKSVPAASALGTMLDMRTTASALRELAKTNRPGNTSAAAATVVTEVSARNTFKSGQEEDAAPLPPISFTFLDIYGARADVEDDGDAVGFDTSTGGLMTGIGGVADLPFGGDVVPVSWGVAIFANETSVDTFGGTAEVDGLGVGVFAGFQRGAWAFDASLAYAALDFDFERAVAAGVLATGETDGDAIVATFEGTYFLEGEYGGFALSPYVGLDLIHVNYDAYNEAGAGILNLAVEGDELSVGFLRAGVNAQGTSVEVGDGFLTTAGQIGLEYGFGDLDATANATLAALPGAVFTEAVTGIDRTRLTVGAGLIYEQGNLTATARYDGSIGERSESHRATLGLTLSF